mmetsp:Transcript_5452/g.17734  ORF Transcript_5452/g.17734 Transcript_5452/m.17734 type:complete len:233 (+) Transcript_5452:534-1232(+)
MAEIREIRRGRDSPRFAEIGRDWQRFLGGGHRRLRTAGVRLRRRRQQARTRGGMCGLGGVRRVPLQLRLHGGQLRRRMRRLRDRGRAAREDVASRGGGRGGGRRRRRRFCGGGGGEGAQEEEEEEGQDEAARGGRGRQAGALRARAARWDPALEAQCAPRDTSARCTEGVRMWSPMHRRPNPPGAPRPAVDANHQGHPSAPTLVYVIVCESSDLSHLGCVCPPLSHTSRDSS